MSMKRSVLAAVVIAALALAAGGARAAEGGGKLRVLLLSGANNHKWKETTPALKEIYAKSGRFVVTVTDDPASLKADDFAKYDVIVSNWTPWPKVTLRIWDEATEKAFLDFIRGGGGLVVFHASSTALQTWPEFQQLACGTWGKGTTGHGPRHDFEVKIADKDHPITKGVPAFKTFDELWHRMTVQPNRTVLATAFSSSDKKGTGQDEPVAFVTTMGKGRGYNLVLGHDVKAMSFPGWRALMLRGTEWAATGKVTIPVPKELTGASGPAGKADGYAWKETDTTVALVNGEEVVWRFDRTCKNGEKPFFHPLATTDGTPLTWLRPPDHVWHLAMWFSWKHLDGVNYWERNKTTGAPDGKTDIKRIETALNADHSARIEMAVDYHPVGAAETVLAEKCVIDVSAPDEAGSYRVDWTSTFTAGATDVALKGGTHGGGYAGLSIRLAELTKEWTVVNSEGLRDEAAHGQKARWVAWSGETAAGKSAAVAMFDHPKNVRHPSPWYVAVRRKVPFNYFSPALLYSEPYTLAAGKTMTLKYRTLIQSAPADAKAMQSEWKAFAK